MADSQSLSAAPGVTVIIPAYNAAPTVCTAISSALGSSATLDVQVVVVDDGSTDGTPDVVRNTFGSTAAVELVLHGLNRGGGAARNTAVMAAAHDLVFCLDSDNLLLPGSLDALVAKLQATGADAVSFGSISYFKNDPSQITHRWVYGDGPYTLADALHSTVLPISSGNYLYHRDSWQRVGGYPEFAGSLDAWGFGFRQVAEGHVMLAVPGSTYLHRYGHDSYWVRDEHGRRATVAALQLLLPYLDRVAPEDQEYILRPENRGDWLHRLPDRPIRVMDGPAKGGGKVVLGTGRRADGQMLLAQLRARLARLRRSLWR